MNKNQILDETHKISIEIKCPCCDNVIPLMNQIKGIIDKYDVFNGAKIVVS